MKDKIKKCHLDAWSSTISGIDVDKSVSSVHQLFIEELKEVEKDYEGRMQTISDISDSFEVDMENSNNLLVEVLPFIEKYKQIQSNHPLLYQELGTLIYRIEEQIIKNGK